MPLLERGVLLSSRFTSKHKSKCGGCSDVSTRKEEGQGRFADHIAAIPAQHTLGLRMRAR